MSVFAVTEELLKRLDAGNSDLVVLNFANADMVGHTGVMASAVRAIEAVDACVGMLVEKARAKGGRVIITADHGNAETMVDENGGPHTAHTTDRVPLILVDDTRIGARLRAGILADIAPTILEILGLSKPAEMTGQSLIEAE